MSDTVIHVENVWKQYRLGAISHGTLKADFASWWARMQGKEDPNLKIGQAAKSENDSKQEERFWALKDINFEVKQGEVLGIIGRNGAGKSTLLKILSRVTTPTSGQIKIKGRIASLLEVGTGFHPELTGRENIFLNGAILGMNKAEIRAKLDEIVDFSGVERFIDTPVKRYSSGMYVRLAFAVAAHLDPEILIIDEVLAVGDAEFQKKCLGKMGEVAKCGRTVLFVSHNMNSIEQLCNSSILLSNGQVFQRDKDVGAVIKNYLNDSFKAENREWLARDEKYNNIWFSPQRFYIGDENGNISESKNSINNPILIYVDGITETLDPSLQVGIALYESSGSLLFWSFSSDDDSRTIKYTQGKNRLSLEIPAHLLNEGKYKVELAIALYNRMWICPPGAETPSITIEIAGGFLSSKQWTHKRPGILGPKLKWSTNNA